MYLEVSSWPPCSATRSGRTPHRLRVRPLHPLQPSSAPTTMVICSHRGRHALNVLIALQPLAAASYAPTTMVICSHRGRHALDVLVLHPIGRSGLCTYHDGTLLP